MFSLKEIEHLLKEEISLWSYLDQARIIKDIHWGSYISTCAIVNAKSGRCPSDCKFCAQSSFWPTGVKEYPLLSAEALWDHITKAAQAGIDRFSFVTSGISLSPQELDSLLEVIKKARKAFPNLKFCASLGQLSRDELYALKEAGLSRYHHNLETAASFYPYICTKQEWKDRYKTALLVKEVGLSLCCGGIFGLGEKVSHIMEFILTLRDISPDCIPINFLHPIPGTPLEKASYLTPKKALRILIAFRLLYPEACLCVCGGREYNLRDLQCLALLPANALMVGNYLTTKGRLLEDDINMIKDLGYKAFIYENQK